MSLLLTNFANLTNYFQQPKENLSSFQNIFGYLSG